MRVEPNGFQVHLLNRSDTTAVVTDSHLERTGKLQTLLWKMSHSWKICVLSYSSGPAVQILVRITFTISWPLYGKMEMVCSLIAEPVTSSE